MIGLYRGKSALSRVIRFVNWSEYSHASWIDDDDGSVYEAWVGGVRHNKSIHDNHTPGTLIDLFDVGITTGERQAVREFIQSQIGKKYDFAGVKNFITRRAENPKNQEKWFCSELVFAAFQSAKVNLLERVPAWKVSPGLLSYSPLLIAAGGVVVSSKSAAKDIRPPQKGINEFSCPDINEPVGI